MLSFFKDFKIKFTRSDIVLLQRKMSGVFQTFCSACNAQFILSILYKLFSPCLLPSVDLFLDDDWDRQNEEYLNPTFYSVYLQNRFFYSLVYLGKTRIQVGHRLSFVMVMFQLFYIAEAGHYSPHIYYLWYST